MFTPCITRAVTPHSCHMPLCMQASRARGCYKTVFGLYQCASSPLRQQASKQASHVVTNIQLPIIDIWYTDGLFWRFYCHWSHLKFTVCCTQGLVLMFLSTSIYSTIHYSNEHHILMLNSMKKGQFVTYNRQGLSRLQKPQALTLITFMYIIIHIYKWTERGRYRNVWIY
jgi:hypothetical protein